MKKSLLLLASLALIGAGCTSTTNIDTTTQADVNVDKTATDNAEATSENTTETTADGTTVIKSDGLEATIQVVPETKTKSETSVKEDGVPVTEIQLGNPDVKVTMETGNYFFNPKTITASAGQKIQIQFTKNTGSHNFIIDKLQLNHTIKQGEGLTFTAPTEPGSYPFYCGIGSHRSMGMEGTLIVK